MNYSDSFRAARWMRFINLLLQAVLFLTLFAGLNYIALNHSWRFDLTRGRVHSLSAETKSYLARLERPVTVTVTIANDERADEELAQAYRDISALLREYEYQARKNPVAKIELRFLDVYKNGRKAEELGIDQPNVVVLDSGANRRVLNLGEFYRTKDRRRDAFQGEMTLTAALLDVSNPDKKKIYFISGHGEMSPNDTSPNRGLSQLRDELRARNFDVGQLNLSLTRAIPANEDPLLIIASPESRFQPYEEELLRNYLSTRAGRVILLLDPRGNQGLGLENLLFDWGIMVHDKLIIDPHPNSLTETNDLRFWTFARDAESRITDVMINNDFALHAGETRVVTDDISRPADDGLRVAKLVATSPNAWGESAYRLGGPPVYTPGEDLRGQLGAMVISERLKPANNLPFSVRGGRLAVFGTATIASNQRLYVGGNLNFLAATINWTADRDEQVNIPVRQIQRFSVALSQEDQFRLRLGLFLIVPGIVALIGLIVYWTRRD